MAKKTDNRNMPSLNFDEYLKNEDFVHENMTEDQRMLLQLPTLSVPELEKAIYYHNDLYNKGKPIISDGVYDQLTDTLRKKSPNNPALIALTSPFFEKTTDDVVHAIPMLSLHKPSKNRVWEEFQNWLNLFYGDLIATPKIDGLSCSVIYDANGNFLQASTRGDGHTGKDVSPQATFIPSIPKHIQKASVEVRGEIYMPLHTFRAFKGEKISARNLAVGGLKQKNPAQAAEYNLHFFAYEIIGMEFKTELEKFEFLANNNFEIPNYHIIQRNNSSTHHSSKSFLESIKQYCLEETTKRDHWDFDADGLVFKVLNTEDHQRLGATDHHPRYALAYKFPCMETQTILRKVIWQVAKGATITPVAVFDAVKLAGAMVQRATLSNASMVKTFPLGPSGERGCTHLKLNSILQVSRRGDVIPHVEYVVDEPEECLEVNLPTLCPSCGAPVLEEGLFLKCSNPENCPATGQALLENYTKVTDCMGLGSKIIEALFDSGKVATPADLYRLQPDDIAEALNQEDDNSRSTAVLPQKLYNAIQNTKLMQLSTFLEALSIPVLGRVKARDLANHYQTIEEILKADIQSLKTVVRGDKTPTAIYDGIQQRTPLIRDLLQYVQLETNTIQKTNNSENNPFFGKKVLFTGSLTSMKREDAQKRVQNLGGQIATSVTKNLDILVATETTTSKWTKATALNEKGAQITLWTETDFLEALKLIEE